MRKVYLRFMRKVYLRFRRKLPSSRTLEYGLIAAGVGVAIMTIVDHAGSDLNMLLASAGLPF